MTCRNRLIVACMALSLIAFSAGTASAAFLSPAAVVEHSAEHSPGNTATFGPLNGIDGDPATFVILENDGGTPDTQGHYIMDMTGDPLKVFSFTEFRYRSRPTGGRPNAQAVDIITWSDDDPTNGTLPSDDAVDVQLQTSLVIADTDHGADSDHLLPSFTKRYVGLKVHSDYDTNHTNWQFADLFFDGTIENIPEPSSFVLTVLCLLGLPGFGWRRRKRRS